MDSKEKALAAIDAHKSWADRLRLDVENGTGGLSVDMAKVDDACEFGAWLYGEFPRALVGEATFREIRDLHARFHREAAEVLQLATERGKGQALAALGNDGAFQQTSIALTAQLQMLSNRLW